MKRYLSLLFLVIGCLAGVVTAYAQQPVVSVEMDSTYVTIGCPMTFHLKAHVPQGQQLTFPQNVVHQRGIVAHDDSASYLLELDTFKSLTIDTVAQSDGSLMLSQDITVFAFDSAALYIPPFEFVTSLGDTLRTNALALKVFVPFESIEVDPEKFVGLKDVEDPEFVFMDYIWWLLVPLIIMAVLAAAWFGWNYYKKHRTEKPVDVPQAKPLPAHVLAMQALDQLAEKKLWQNGHDKEYHTELTDILRQYIEQRFGVQAMEQTSDEILDSLYELAESQKASLANLKQILSMADFVKFAKYKPFADENQLSFTNSRLFIEQTKKADAEEPIAAAEAEDTKL